MLKPCPIQRLRIDVFVSIVSLLDEVLLILAIHFRIWDSEYTEILWKAKNEDQIEQQEHSQILRDLEKYCHEVG